MVEMGRSMLGDRVGQIARFEVVVRRYAHALVQPIGPQLASSVSLPRAMHHLVAALYAPSLAEVF